MSTEQLYEAYKPLLFALAYRMLGSVMDAEDMVQEAFLSLNRGDAVRIRNMKSYLCKVVTNRCLDRLRSASRQREQYIGPWLPEPLIGEEQLHGDPEEGYLLKESVTTAYLLLLHQLSAVERAVFLLREVLQYEYDEIADMVGKSPTNCRQIFHRAKRSLGSRPAPAEPRAASASAAANEPVNSGPALPLRSDALAAKRLVEQFVQALTAADVPRLLALLAEDAVLYSDGGGKINAAVRPILSAGRIAQFLLGLLGKVPEDFAVRPAIVNGVPGLISYGGHMPINTVSFHLKDGVIEGIYLVVNPDKLEHVPRLLS
ncbi:MULTISPECIES: sigma-70 family RNA polymerase sigma factor [unclassified Paenibacillus]|uniref:sigma-70 family RNA polymerase sigma factor n=1 Tax=unclassified Paenibacillus TaxID=185978 RepID=UPI000B8772EE|nr:MULTISPECIES: sigma-70 family RNA polymerase sigma factor [unclassified Paenibacillus]